MNPYVPGPIDLPTPLARIGAHEVTNAQYRQFDPDHAGEDDALRRS